jgi:peptidoglycan-associated lipoprotein
MKLKLIGALAAMALLAACSSKAPVTGGIQGGGGAPPVGESGPAPGSEEDLVRNVGDRVFFELNSSKLTDTAQATLDKQAAWLAKYANVTVQVAGNCDDRGTEEFNLALGNRRAKAAKDYLVAKGVSSSRITTISYGKDRPTALGDNDEAWAQNRNAITSVK